MKSHKWYQITKWKNWCEKWVKMNWKYFICGPLVIYNEKIKILKTTVEEKNNRENLNNITSQELKQVHYNMKSNKWHQIKKWKWMCEMSEDELKKSDRFMSFYLIKIGLDPCKKIVCLW